MLRDIPSPCCGNIEDDLISVKYSLNFNQVAERPFEPVANYCNRKRAKGFARITDQKPEAAHSCQRFCYDLRSRKCHQIAFAYQYSVIPVYLQSPSPVFYLTTPRSTLNSRRAACPARFDTLTSATLFGSPSIAGFVRHPPARANKTSRYRPNRYPPLDRCGPVRD